jgi:hypothetical protein
MLFEILHGLQQVFLSKNDQTKHASHINTCVSGLTKFDKAFKFTIQNFLMKLHNN